MPSRGFILLYPVGQEEGVIASTSIIGTGNGGTKVKVTGSIDAFGSIYVGGIQFDTNELDVILNGAAGN